MTIKVLDNFTVRNLHSGQVIVDLEAIVKELLENALDAHANSIDFTFVNNGLESIQIKDNGDGIEEEDRTYIAKQHYTSKIKEFEDLEKVESYGFRGEAMHAICSISDKMTVVTKTKNDVIAKQYDIDKEGSLINEKVTNTLANSGTIITIYKPFYNLPVRRQLAQKNATNTMKKIQELLIKYALTHPKVRFSSTQTKDTAGVNNKNDSNNNWIKPVTPSIEKTMLHLFGATFNDMLERFIETDESNSDAPVTVDVVIPKPNSDPSITLKGPERIFFYVNQRPINYVKSELKDLVTLIRNRYRETIGLTETTIKKTPFIYIDIQLPPNKYDVNIEPNKTTILFHEKDRIVNLVQKILDTVYPTKVDQFFSKAPTTSHIQEPSKNDWDFSMVESDDRAMENWQIENASDTPHGSTSRSSSWTPINQSSSPPSAHHQVQNKATHLLPSDTAATVIPKKRSIKPTEHEAEKIRKHSKFQSALPFESLSSYVPAHASPGRETIQDRTPLLNNITSPSTVQTSVSPRSSSVVQATGDLSTTAQEITPLVQLPPNSSQKPRPTLQTPSTKPRRDITSLFKNSKTTASSKPPSIQQLCNTLNQSLTIDCDFNDIKSNYPQRKEILSETYRIRVDDYLAMNDYGHTGQISRVVEKPIGLEKHGLSLYTRGNPSVLDRQRQQVYQIGVIQLKSVCLDGIVNRLMKEKKLVCKKNFERPVQTRMDLQDKLCPLLIRLKSKECYVEDDLHGSKKITYSEIVDDIIVNNGFRVRWRKDLAVSNNLIIQFTGIYSLGSGYGTADFRELLSLIMEAKEGEFVRPNKVIQYFKSLAEEIYNNQPDEKDLESALDNLVWKNNEDDRWQLGYSSTSGKILACMLASSKLVSSQ
ncbi:hypothetical protein BD770DRAFT_400670 [Pilaira anomala]|nr:hypothetical protein BD770DRAFT_400670 [Pilaira anomala]